MATMKEIALQASDDAFREAVRARVSALVNNLVLAKTPEEREAHVAKHKEGLAFCKDVHVVNVAAINDVFR